MVFCPYSISSLNAAVKKNWCSCLNSPSYLDTTRQSRKNLTTNKTQQLTKITRPYQLASSFNKKLKNITRQAR